MELGETLLRDSGIAERAEVEAILESHHSSPKNKLLYTTSGMSRYQQKQHSKHFSKSMSGEDAKPSRFTCNDGSVIDLSRVNDDYCDCISGEDEPGTSACSGNSDYGRGVASTSTNTNENSNGGSDDNESQKGQLFYCMNDGFMEKSIFTSRVNDGICDCCDGSDEGMFVTCRNSCEDAAAAHYEATRSLRKSFETGSNLRSKFIESATAKFSEETSEFEKLEASVVTSQENLQLLELEHEQAVAKKRDELQVARTKGLAALKELVTKTMNSDSVANEIDLLHSLLKVLGIDHDAADVMVKDWRESIQNKDTGNHDEHDNTSDEYDGEGSDGGDDHDDDESEVITLEGDESFDSNAAGSSQNSNANLHKILGRDDTATDFLLHILEKKRSYSQLQCLLAFHKIHGHFIDADYFVLKHNDASKDPFQCAQAYNEFTSPVDLEHYCGLYGVIQTLVNDIIYSFVDVDDSSLTQARDAVAEEQQNLKIYEEKQEQYDAHLRAESIAFLSLEDKCFSLLHQKYEYKVCFGIGGIASQRDTGGGMTTLGTFSDISFDDKSGNTELSYTEGAHCWNHGARVAHVSIKCGAATVLERVSEPSTCLYHLEMQSPAACAEAVKELWGLNTAF